MTSDQLCRSLAIDVLASLTTAEEAFNKACKLDRQVINLEDDSMNRFTTISSRDTYLDVAALLDEDYKPRLIELTALQASVVERAKYEIKDAYWYKGIRLELLPETDREIREIGVTTIVDQLVKYTIAHDCDYILDSDFAVVRENDNYLIHYLSHGFPLYGQYNMINGVFSFHEITPELYNSGIRVAA